MGFFRGELTFDVVCIMRKVSLKRYYFVSYDCAHTSKISKMVSYDCAHTSKISKMALKSFYDKSPHLH